MENIEDPAARVVVGGTHFVPENIRVERFGKLVLVDPEEIEAYTSIRTYISDYFHNPLQTQPLSIQHTS